VCGAGHLAVCVRLAARREREARAAAAPTMPQDAPGKVGPAAGSSEAPASAGKGRPVPRKRPGKRRPTPHQPLPAPAPDSDWKVTLDVPLRTISPNRLVGEHHFARAKRRSAERAAIRKAFAGVGVPELPVIVTLLRRGPALLDSDALPFALKSIRDCIAKGFRVDDGPRGPIEWRYAQHVERVKEPHRIKARSAAPAKNGYPARKARPARDTWRFIVSLRITIESLSEPASEGGLKSCSEARFECADPWRFGGNCARK